MDKTMAMGRRGFLAGAGAAALGTTLPATARAEGNEVWFAFRGGVNGDVQRKVVLDPFTKESGIVVKTSAHPALAKVQAMVRTNTVDFDLCEYSGREIGFLTRKGLLEPINYALLPKDIASQFIVPDAALKYGLATYVSGGGIAYNNKVFPEGKHPRTWADFFDVKKFPGPRTMADASSNLTPLEVALIADGVPPDKLFPLDIDRAFKKLDTVKSSVVKWTPAVGDMLDLLLQGNAHLAMISFGRIVALQMQGGAQEIGVERNEAVCSVYYWVVPKGAKNPANAHKLMAFAAGIENATDYANAYPSYGPVVKGVMERVKPETNKLMINAPTNNIIYLKDDWWNEDHASGKTNYEYVLERWSQWVG
jgi:putative spermidine/putrescine transport system substrate-binding protein